jgi:hydrogenase maturation protease
MSGDRDGGILVVGYGNRLRSDDGAGPAAALLLAVDPRLAGVDVRAAHQLTPELAMDVSSARLVVLIDAEDGLPPGDVAVRPVEPPPSEAGPSYVGSPAARPMSHHLDPEGLLGLASSLYGSAPPTSLVTIGTGSLDLGEHLTPPVQAGVARAVQVVIDLVQEHPDA